MAEQRLELLMKKTDAQYTDGSPILLEACALYLDKHTNNCVAQLKWKNIDSRPIKAVMIELDGYDTFDQKLEPVHFQYDGLLVTQGSEFGGKTPVIIKNNKVVKYDVVLKAVSFLGDAIWRAEKSVAFENLPESKPPKLEGEILDQLTRDLAKKGNRIAASFSPQKAMGLWQCGCGSWQQVDSQCLKCRISLKALEDASDESVLKGHLKLYKEEQERLRIEAEKKAEEERIAREKAEKERQEREDEERKRREEQARIAAEEAARRKAKHRKIGMISAAVVLALAVAAYFVVPDILKEKKYNDAKALIMAGSYTEPRTALTELGDYKECSTLMKVADANELFEKRQFAEAYELYAMLPTEYQIHAYDYEYNYNLASDEEKKGDYESAARKFGLLGNYKDSVDRKKQAEIEQKEALAQNYKEIGMYIDAQKIYLELGHEEEANECIYLLADAVAASKPWYAYEKYVSLGDYKDSAERAADLYAVRFEKIGDTDINNLRSFYDPEYGGIGLLDSNADVLVSPVYSFVVLNENNTYTAQSDGKVGVFDAAGKEIIPFIYDGINVINGNYYVERDSLFGVFKPDGTVLIPVQYDSISIQDGQYIVSKDGKVDRITFDETINGKSENDDVSSKSNQSKSSIDQDYGIADSTSFVFRNGITWGMNQSEVEVLESAEFNGHQSGKSDYSYYKAVDLGDIKNGILGYAFNLNSGRLVSAWYGIYEPSDEECRQLINVYTGLYGEEKEADIRELLEIDGMLFDSVGDYKTDFLHKWVGPDKTTIWMCMRSDNNMIIYYYSPELLDQYVNVFHG